MLLSLVLTDDAGRLAVLIRDGVANRGMLAVSAKNHFSSPSQRLSSVGVPGWVNPEAVTLLPFLLRAC